MKTVFVMGHNHFDPTWRRCFDRKAVYNGVAMAPYADVEELVVEKWLTLAKDGLNYSEGQVAVWRKYFERRPERLKLIKKHIKEGRILVLLAGETVQDTTMPAPEGLVRNFLVAEPFYRELCGEDHRGLKLGTMEDAFGTSPNYPQILKDVGAEYALSTSYKSCPELIWVGIDGTKLRCYDKLPLKVSYDAQKHLACPECHGFGCKVCKETGMVVLKALNYDGVCRSLEAAAQIKGDKVGILLGGEETIPDECEIKAVRDLNRKHKGKIKFLFATQYEFIKAYEAKFRAAEKKRGSKPTVDLNPAQPGCYVTRIEGKKETRELTYKLVAAEAALAKKAWKVGKPVALPASFSRAWQLVAFNQFHDAITGTHMDSAQVELQDMRDEARKIVDKYAPAVPQTKQKDKFRSVGHKTITQRWGNLAVTAGWRGVEAVKCNGKDVFAPFRHKELTTPPWCIGELSLECDFGDAWGQRIEPLLGAEWNVGLRGLGEWHVKFEAAKNAFRWTGKYGGGDWKVKKLSWVTTVRPSADGKRLDYKTEVDWDTHSKRLRVVVPVNSRDKTAVYEAPYGFISRTFDASQFDYSHWHANHQEYPITNWLRKDVDKNSGVVLITKGVPCARWMPRRIDLSLLRSPEWHYCAVETSNYEFWDTNGQRDTGRHVFEYSIWPFTKGLSYGDLTRVGVEFNDAAIKDLPFEVKGDVVVTAFKPAENGEGWILRLFDASGKGTKVALKFKEKRAVTRTDLLERPRSRPVSGKSWSASLHKHGIMTVLIK